MTALHAIRLAMVDDESFLRGLLCQSLAGFDDIEVVGEFGDEATALAKLPGLSPDVLLLDIDLATGGSGLRLGAALQKRLPKLAIVLFSNNREVEYLAALSGGAGLVSYLHKKSLANTNTLASAIRAAAAGLVVLDRHVASDLIVPSKPRMDLGERDRTLLSLVAEGYSNRAIAHRLSLSEKSIENQLSQLYRSLGVDTGDTDRHARVTAASRFLAGA